MSQNVVIAMSGISKVFVGEVVEEGEWWREYWIEPGVVFVSKKVWTRGRNEAPVVVPT